MGKLDQLGNVDENYTDFYTATIVDNGSLFLISLLIISGSYLDCSAIDEVVICRDVRQQIMSNNRQKIQIVYKCVMARINSMGVKRIGPLVPIS